MNLSKDFGKINLNPFNHFYDRDQDMRDPDINYFNDLNSNNFDSPYFSLEENVKRYLCDIKKYDGLSLSLSLIHVNIRSMNSNFEFY